MILKDDSMMPMGQYKNKLQMANVPAKYLLWLWDQWGTTKPFGAEAQAVADYIADNLDALRKEVNK